MESENKPSARGLGWKSEWKYQSVFLLPMATQFCVGPDTKNLIEADFHHFQMTL